MTLTAIAASNGGPASGIPAGDLVVPLSFLAAIVLLVGLLSLGAIVFLRWRRLPRSPSTEQAELPELPDAWVEAGRRMKE